MGQSYQSSFFSKIADVKTEEGEEFINVAFVDQAEAVKFRETRSELPVFYVCDPIMGHI